MKTLLIVLIGITVATPLLGLASAVILLAVSKRKPVQAFAVATALVDILAFITHPTPGFFFAAIPMFVIANTLIFLETKQKGLRAYALISGLPVATAVIWLGIQFLLELG